MALCAIVGYASVEPSIRSFAYILYLYQKDALRESKKTTKSQFAMCRPTQNICQSNFAMEWRIYKKEKMEKNSMVDYSKI